MGFFDSFSRSFKPNNTASTIYDLLKKMKKENGTELRITPGVAPQIIVKGRPLPLSEFPLEAEESRKLCYSMLAGAQKSEFEKNNKIEFVFGIKDIGRYKANIISVEGKVSGTFTIHNLP